MTTSIEFYFDPSRTGVAVFLGPAQARLMEIAWRHGYVSARLARTRIGRKSKLSYSAVRAVLEILCAKRFLKRKKQGRFQTFVPTVSREQFIRQRVATIKRCLKASFGKN